MAGRDEIIEFCDELLDAGSFTDYGPNGLQVPGAAEVGKVVTGVSAHRELIERAVDAGADMLITHHGLFWEFLPRALSEPMAERLRAALGAELSIAGVPPAAGRAPGDRQQRAAARRSSASRPRPSRSAWRKDRPIGVVGRSADGIAAAELIGRVRSLTGREPLVFDAGRGPVRSIGIVSGAGASIDPRGGRAWPGRAAHRRAGRARDGRRPRGRPALHRRRPLRDRDVRGPAPRRARRRAVRRSSTSSSTCRTRSESPQFARIFVDTSAPSDKT